MIDKIKAEIERLNYSPMRISKWKTEAYKECLKWAEELREDLIIGFGDSFDISAYEFNKILKKAFHGGQNA